MRPKLAVLALPMLWACSADAPRHAGAEVRDSAGIRIVTSSAPALAPERLWRVHPEPVLDFGPEHDLHRTGSILRLRDGRIAVAHTGQNEIIIFDKRGELVTRFGRAGGGPGEFREISRLFTIGGGDSLLVFDFPQFRASIFDTDGRLARSFTPPTLGAELPSMVTGVFDDGSLLLATLTPPSGEERGLMRHPRELWRSTADGGSPVRLARLPGQEMFLQDSPWGPPDLRRPYFGRTAVYATGRDRVYWAATEEFAIHVHGLDGTRLATLRRRGEPPAVTRALVDRLIDEQLSGVADENARREARRMLENLPEPDHAPALGWPSYATGLGPDLLVDDEGNLWVAEFHMPGEGRNARAVFDTAGVWLGTVELPPRFAPTHIGADFVLGRWRDEFDVEHIRLHTLIK